MFDIPAQPIASSRMPAPSKTKGGSGFETGGSVFSVPLMKTTQGPFWPPSEIADQNGDFVLVGGFVLKEIAPGKISPVPNEKGVIVSKNTLPPLRDGNEDFSNPFGSSYQIVRDLDLGAHGKDWDLVLYSLSCGPFFGNFGGGQPRIPGSRDSQYNLNANPRWNREVAPVGSESPTYYRPNYALHQVPIWRLDEIPRYISIGVAIDPSGGGQDASADFRERRPITLREYLRGNGQMKIGLLPSTRGVFSHARFDFEFRGLLPNSLFAIWALHAAGLLPPSDPRFLLPVPLAIPNVVQTDAQGDAQISFEVPNPFPDPANDPQLNRIVAIAITYFSDFQNWGAALTSLGTGVSAHTVMNANLSQIQGLITKNS